MQNKNDTKWNTTSTTKHHEASNHNSTVFQRLEGARVNEFSLDLTK